MPGQAEKKIADTLSTNKNIKERYPHFELECFQFMCGFQVFREEGRSLDRGRLLERGV